MRQILLRILTSRKSGQSEITGVFWAGSMILKQAKAEYAKLQ
jgi:hypothetical protein